LAALAVVASAWQYFALVLVVAAALAVFLSAFVLVLVAEAAVAAAVAALAAAAAAVAKQQQKNERRGKLERQNPNQSYLIQAKKISSNEIKAARKSNLWQQKAACDDVGANMVA
jgi:hypothetical protein